MKKYFALSIALFAFIAASAQGVVLPDETYTVKVLRKIPGEKQVELGRILTLPPFGVPPLF